MIILKKELHQGRLSLLVWTLLLAGMLGLCILIFPEMEEQMQQMSSSFTEMGDFTAAFGMDELNIGKFQDFIGIEGGNIMGLLGVMFASLLGIKMIASEEDGHTAEFLLTHPISRSRVILEKLVALVIQITVLNVAVALISFALMALVQEEYEFDKLGLLFFSFYLAQLEVGCISFGISAFLRRNSFGLGIGIGALAYFLNIISNLIEELEFLKYITPLSYTDSATILYDGSLPMEYVGTGMIFLVVFVLLAFMVYRRKEIS